MSWHFRTNMMVSLSWVWTVLGLKCLYTEHTSNKYGQMHCIGACQLQRSTRNELARELVPWNFMRLVGGPCFRDRKLPRTFVPGSKSLREQKFQETKVPVSELDRERTGCTEYRVYRVTIATVWMPCLGVGMSTGWNADVEFGWNADRLHWPPAQPHYWSVALCNADHASKIIAAYY